MYIFACIFVYTAVILVTAAGTAYGIGLALRSFRSRRVRYIRTPVYPENDAEYELRRLMRLYPNAVLAVPCACPMAYRSAGIHLL